MKNSNLDRFESDYHLHRFPDPQEKEVMNYSTCTGCEEEITDVEVLDGTILEIYGMTVHDDIGCIKKAVEARTATLEED